MPDFEVGVAVSITKVIEVTANNLDEAKSKATNKMIHFVENPSLLDDILFDDIYIDETLTKQIKDEEND